MTLTAILAEVAGWLAQKGLFADSRAFRFLLPLLENMGQLSQVIAAIDSQFFVNAVASGFPATSMIANISVGLRCAGRLKNWEAMARLVELSRAVESFEEERLGDTLVEFSDVVVAVLGGQAFADRLLHDGRTTVPPRAGIELCAELDSHGCVPPWDEYLAALAEEEERSNVSYSAESNEKVAAAWFRGQLRRRFLTSDSILPERDRTLLVAFIDENALPPARTIAALCDVFGPGETLEIVGLIKARGPYAMALAERLSHEEDVTGCAAALAMAAGQPPAGWLHQLFSLGVAPEQLPTAAVERLEERLRECAGAVAGERMDRAAVDSWIDLCALAARLAPAALRATLARVRGPGWYRCWLEFVALVSLAEVAQEPSREALAALHALERDLDPATGTMRIYSLIDIRDPIAVTLRRALALLTDADWADGVEKLQHVSHTLRVRGSGETWGPIHLDDFLGMVVSLTTQTRRATTEEAIQHSIGRAGRLTYSQIAGFHMFGARCALRCGDRPAMLARWRAASELLVAYGWRKDRTLFELLDPLDELIRIDLQRAQRCLAKIQSTCLRVIHHTDGKGTRWALTRWSALAAAADAEAASRLIASDALGHCNDVYERHENTRVELWRTHFRAVHPVVAGALRLTIATSLESDDPAALQLLVDHLGQHDSPPLRRLLRYLTARLDERPIRYSYSNSADLLTKDDAVIVEINAILDGASLPRVIESISDVEPPGRSRPASEHPRRVSPRLEFLLDALVVEDFGKGSLGIARLLRRIERDPTDSVRPGSLSTRHANAFGYRLLEMVEAGQLGEAEAALRALAHEVRYRTEQPILQSLAEGLELRGQSRLAAIAHVLCWTRSRGGGGWLTFGGDTRLESLGCAVALDRSAALDELALEIGGVITEARGSLGVTQALVYAFALLDLGPAAMGGADLTSREVAFAIWDAAAHVISARTPKVVPDDDPSPVYVPSGLLDGDRLERALSLAVVAGLGHPSREQKRRSLLAISLLLELRPTVVGNALAFALGLLSDPTTLSWLLWLLRSMAEVVRGALGVVAPTLEQLCQSEFLVVRSLARELLDFIGGSPGSLPVGDALPALANSASSPRSHTTAFINHIARDRIEAVRPVLPGLLGMLAKSIDHHAPDTRERMEDQRRDLSSASDRNLPDALVANIEIVETELQRLAGSGRASLAVIGNRIPDPEAWERRLSSRLENSPVFALALERSREPRPEIEFRPVRRDRRGTLNTTVATNVPVVASGPFQGYRILASVEKRSRGDYYDASPPSARYLGVELGSALDPDNDFPIGEADLGIWFSPALSAPVPEGPLVGIDETFNNRSGKLGLGWTCPVLVPHPWILSTLQLIPDGNDLAFVDANGIGLALRTWRAQYQVDDYRLTRPLLDGAQVVIRDDLFQQLVVLCGPRLVLRDFFDSENE